MELVSILCRPGAFVSLILLFGSLGNIGALAQVPDNSLQNFTAPVLSTTESTLTPATPAPAGAEEDLANFGDTIKVAGQMDRTDQDYKDGLALDLHSPINRTLVVTQNTNPLSASFVTGSSGEPWVALSTYSYVIKTSDNAKDLIAKVELPYDPTILKSMGIDPSNTYVGTLSADKKSWIVSENQRNVHVTENKTRIINMASLDGEYLLLGRNTSDTSNIFVQYGQGATRTVNITGGPGIQEAEFIDGLRFSVMSNQDMTMNVEIKSGIEESSLPAQTKALNSFAWAVNTSVQTGSNILADMRVPVNRDILDSVSGGLSSQAVLMVAKRPLTGSGQFDMVTAQATRVGKNTHHVMVKGVKDLDGEYIVLVSDGGNVGGTSPGGTSLGGTSLSGISTTGTSLNSASSNAGQRQVKVNQTAAFSAGTSGIPGSILTPMLSLVAATVLMSSIF